jgi:hypothetical protein
MKPIHTRIECSCSRADQRNNADVRRYAHESQRGYAFTSLI